MVHMKLLTFFWSAIVRIQSVQAYEPQSFPLTSLESGVNGLTLQDIVTNIIETLVNTIFYVSAAIFVYGAFLYVASAFKEDQKNNGKEFMIGALIGLGIVLCAKVILNITLAFIYAP